VNPFVEAYREAADPNHPAAQAAAALKWAKQNWAKADKMYDSISDDKPAIKKFAYDKLVAANQAVKQAEAELEKAQRQARGWDKPTAASWRYRNDHLDSHSGQDDFVLRALDGDDQIGSVAYSVVGKKAHVDMIRTEPGHQRKGVATGLMDELRRLWMGKVTISLQTDEGAAFFSKYKPKR
jgi:GNAT superfamily N-acetyltransferase